MHKRQKMLWFLGGSVSTFVLGNYISKKPGTYHPFGSKLPSITIRNKAEEHKTLVKLYRDFMTWIQDEGLSMDKKDFENEFTDRMSFMNLVIRKYEEN